MLMTTGPVRRVIAVWADDRRESSGNLEDFGRNANDM